MRRLKVGPELEGLYLARTVWDQSGRHVLVRQGVRLTQPLLGALQRRGVRSVWVSNELLPDLEVQEVVRDETRQLVDQTLSEVTRAIAEGAATERQLQALSHSVRSLVDEILENHDVVSNISHLQAHDDYTFAHSVQVAILSVLIGRELGLTRYQLYRLGTGAILHDIGKVAIPQYILTKPGKLTSEEFATMKTHCQIGWDILQEHPTIMPTSAIVVLQHHERLDGSGYPYGLLEPNIHLYAKIAAVADVFDAMRADRTYRPARTPPEIVAALETDAGVRLHAETVRVLFRRVALVSQGEIVRLSNSFLGVVTAHNPGHPLAPRVFVVADGANRPVTPSEENLKDSGITVTEVLADWPAELARTLRHFPLSRR